MLLIECVTINAFKNMAYDLENLPAANIDGNVITSDWIVCLFNEESVTIDGNEITGLISNKKAKATFSGNVVTIEFTEPKFNRAKQILLDRFYEVDYTNGERTDIVSAIKEEENKVIITLYYNSYLDY